MAEKLTEAQHRALQLRAEHDLRDTSTQSTAGKKARTAFDIPAGTTSAVTLAVKPRKAAYRAGPGISVTNSAQGRRDAEMRRVMRLTKI